MYCIYKVTNKLNDKFYIGQHMYTDESNPMGKYKGSGKILKAAYKKYGFENFEIAILYQRILNKETIDAMEIWAIEKYKPEYNIARGGEGGDTFTGLSDEAKSIRRQIMSKAVKGERNPFYGKTHTEEVRQIISKANKCTPKPHTDEWNKHVAEATRKFYKDGNHNSSYGKPHTDEHKEAISKSRKGLHWFTNGLVSVQARECPEGFHPGHNFGVKGRTPWNKKRQEEN